MKAIKLSLVALATVLFFGVANAQVGIEVGYSSQIPSTTTAAGTAKGTTLNGFHIGPVYEMSVQGPVSLSYGLLYNYLTATESSVKTVAHRLDLPVRVQAGFPIADGIKILAFAGPNFTMSLGQKVGSLNLADVPNTLDPSKKMFSPFDIQLGAGIGVSYKMITLKGSYDWGMLNRTTMGDAMSIKANDLKIGVAYNF